MLLCFVVDQFVDILQFFRTPVVAEQVIEVPKILPALGDPLLVEQLVEVPTVVSYSFPSSSPPSRTLTFQFLVLVSMEIFKVSSPGQGSTASRVSVAKVVEHSEAVSVAAKAGKFKIASQKTGADKSVAKVSKLTESESVPEKAGTFKTVSQKTEVSSRGARVARPQDVPGQGSAAPLGARVARPQDVHPGQGSTAPRGADLPPHPACQGFPFRTVLNKASGVDGGAPMVMGAPSRTHELSFIVKPQPMSASWRRTSTRKE